MVAVFPALVLFLVRSGTVGSAVQTPTWLPVQTQSIANSEGVFEEGSGHCHLNASGIAISGPGMTACRTQEWMASTYENPSVSAVVSGIERGATVVFRLRESSSQRIEVVIGRFNVITRELEQGTWRTLSTTSRSTDAVNDQSLSPNRKSPQDSVMISLAAEQLSVTVNGQLAGGGRSTLTQGGSVSVGAMVPGEFSVQIDSLNVTDTE